VPGLTKVASADVARLGVRVNAVCPGPVETRMMGSLEAQINPADPVAVHDAYGASIPTGRYGASNNSSAIPTLVFLIAQLQRGRRRIIRYSGKPA
jgi:NAD(P)-dependent dehydrogenase (short-subunit alcohol dehydrogenase family)